MGGRGATSVWWGRLCGLVLAGAGASWGGAPAPMHLPDLAQPGEGQVPAPTDAPERAAEGEELPSLQVRGRLLARVTADGRADYARELELASARIRLSAALGPVEAELSADLASGADLKDAYLRARTEDSTLGVYAGRFKAPFLARTLLSTWQLPLISRGLIDDYLVDRSDLGGRRVGLLVESRLPLMRGASAALGLFEGARDQFGQTLGQDASARVTFKPLKSLSLGSSAYWAQALGAPGQPARRAVAVDASVKLAGLRLSAEGVEGRLPAGATRGGLLLAQYEWALDPAERWRISPLAAGELLQVTSTTVGRGYALTVGANLLWRDRVKVQVEAERAFTPTDASPNTRLRLQLGTRL